jgi:uncharacterized membrane protein
MEGCELDAVAVDLADVEVVANFFDIVRGDVVCGAPDTVCRVVLGCELVLVGGRVKGRVEYVVG